MKHIHTISLVAAFLSLTLFLGIARPASVHAATTPSLGTAATYGVLSNTFTANTGVTAITGDVGYTTLSGSGTITVTGATVTPVPPQAVTDQNTALSALNSEVCTFTFTGVFNIGTDTTHGPVGVYTPGVYCSTGAMNLDAGATITLNGAGTFLFRSLAALDTSAGSQVVLGPGASACDIFWTGIGATTLGANSTFIGTVIDNAGITVGSTVAWTGRALAGATTVTTATDGITVPTGCAPVTPSPTPSSGGGGNTPRFVPLIAVVKVPTPLALPNGPGSVTYNYEVTNPSLQALTGVTLTDDMCDPVTFVSGDSNSDDRLDVDEVWNYMCTTTLGTTTTNTAIATGYGDGGQSAIATAIATVVVGAPTIPPLVSIVKIPSRLTPFPFGGGPVTYTYTVGNPGIVDLHNVTVTDDKCAPVEFASGDTNRDNLLAPDEVWTFTCRTNVAVSTRNIATVRATANGFTALGYAFATVYVGAPTLPNTGLPPISWTTVILAAALLLVLGSFMMVLRKHSRQ